VTSKSTSIIWSAQRIQPVTGPPLGDVLPGVFSQEEWERDCLLDGILELTTTAIAKR
jgi:hypothetical protein